MGILSKLCAGGALALWRQRRDTLRRDAGEGFDQLRIHAGALAGLFSLELREYLGVQRRRLLLLALGFCCAVPAYALAWVLLCCWLGSLWGYLPALLLPLGFHVLLALVFFIMALRMKSSPLAPETCRELHNDWQCLKILIREKANS